MSQIEDRLAELGISLPTPNAPVANYVPFVRVGEMIHISGQVSLDASGGIKGVVGEDVDLETGQRAARLCGLWGPDGPPQNSLGAFQAACAAGYGIELDVQLSADGEAMVFHDEDLQRMTGAAGRLSDRTAAELSELRLKGGDEPIPTLV